MFSKSPGTVWLEIHDLKEDMYVSNQSVCICLYQEMCPIYPLNLQQNVGHAS